MKRRRDTLYLKYLGSRLGEGAASDSAAAERRAALGSAPRPRAGPQHCAQPGSAGPQVTASPEPRRGGGRPRRTRRFMLFPLPSTKLLSATAVSPCSCPCSTSVCVRH